MRRALCTLALTLGCGYHALYGTAASEKLHVALVRVAIPSGAAGEEVARGVREELAKQGALASGDGYPRLEIEVTGASESSEGIEVPPSGRDPLAPTRYQTPSARGLSVAVIARAWVIPRKGAPPERETGDLRVEDLFTAATSDPVTAGLAYEDEQRAAARRLGHKLGARALGDPTAGEGMGR